MKTAAIALSIAPLLSVVAGHGYLTIPSSRTRLNFEVEHAYQVVGPQKLMLDSVAMTLALNAQFWNRCPRSLTSIVLRLGVAAHVVTTRASVQTTTHLDKSGATRRL